MKKKFNYILKAMKLRMEKVSLEEMVKKYKIPRNFAQMGIGKFAQIKKELEA